MILRKPALVHRSLVALFAILFALVQQPVPRAEDTPQLLPFQQNWANTGLITGNDNWTGVAGIVGYLGDYTAASPTGVDPQTLLFDSSGMAEDVIANQLNPNTQITGGVAEFQITDPTIALQGSGTADAPFVLLNVDTTGATGIKVSYNVRDIDGSADNAVQQVALITGSAIPGPSQTCRPATSLMPPPDRARPH
jgi:uncharacterized protein